jgi:hypothetical protein
MRKLVVVLALLAGLLALADRGVAMVSGNAAASAIKLHEGLKESPDVTFRGFPFVTQAWRGKFRAVDVTAHDVVRGGLTMDRIDAHLEGVHLKLDKAVKGKVVEVPVDRGRATVRVSYGNLQTFLAKRAGNLRLVTTDTGVRVRSSFGIPGLGSVDVEGTPTVKVADGNVLRVTVSDVRAVAGSPVLSATLALAAGVRSSFSIPMNDLPFGITVGRAELTPTGLVVDATASGLVIDVQR